MSDSIIPYIAEVKETIIVKAAEGSTAKVNAIDLGNQMVYEIDTRPYEPPKINLTPNPAIAEVGRTLNTVQFTGSVIPGSEAILSQSISPQAVDNDGLIGEFAFSVSSVYKGSKGVAAAHTITVTDSKDTYTKTVGVEYRYPFYRGYSTEATLTGISPLFEKQLQSYKGAYDYQIPSDNSYIYWLQEEGEAELSHAELSLLPFPIRKESYTLTVTSEYSISRTYKVWRSVNRFKAGLLQGLTLFEGSVSLYSGNEVAYGGTLVSMGEYPVAKNSQIKGAHQIFASPSEMMELSTALMEKGMVATLLSYTDTSGKIIPTTQYRLKSVPSQRLSNIEGVQIIDYWEALKDSIPYTGDVQRRYAADYNGGRPLFLPTQITTENYQAGFGDNTQTSIIWSVTYDPEVHRWVSERPVGSSSYGPPLPIAGKGYLKYTYTEMLFKWLPADQPAPATPPSENEPSGWQKTPAVPGYTGEESDYAATYEAYRISNSLYASLGEKDKFGNLSSHRGKPVKISSDPSLVRFSDSVTSEDYLNDWKSYFTPGKDKFIAVRNSVSGSFTVYTIDAEAVYYSDVVYKQFPEDYDVTEADKPKTTLGYGQDGWKHYKFVPDAGYELLASYSKKINASQFAFGGWSLPVRTEAQKPQALYSSLATPSEFPSNLTLAQIQANYGGNFSDWTVEPKEDARWRRDRIGGLWKTKYKIDGYKGDRGNTYGAYIARAYAVNNLVKPTGKRIDASGILLPSQTEYTATKPTGSTFYETYVLVLVNTDVVGNGTPDLYNPEHWSVVGTWSDPVKYAYTEGQPGPAGNDGKSMYQIWLDQGNTGTEQDFLNSYKNKGGVAVRSADGTATTFTIAHGLGGIPLFYFVQAGSPAASNIAYLTSDATHITVHYTTPPASGTNNISLIWTARI